MDTVEQVKSRLDIVEVIQDYLPLKKAGVNYKAPCPFHNEKTPSFVVSPTRQSWHCFGCGEGGDVFTFVQKQEGIEFRDALRLLAQRAGVELKQFKSRTKKGGVLEVLQEAGIFYATVLKTHPNADFPRDYLKKRALTDDTIERFLIGYAPPLWDSLCNYLVSKKFVYKDMLRAGLLTQNDKGKVYDRFRSRLMFPIKNVNGQIVGFGGRILGEEEATGAKYINSPQSDVYDKSTVLYGLSDARFSIKEKNLAIIVEGYFDVVLSHQVDIKNVVAVSGTAMTEQHIRLLKRYTDTVALCFDADSAGIRATERSFAVALQGGMQVLVITLPEEKDPADCVLEGEQIWSDAINNAQKYLDYALSRAESDLMSQDVSLQKKGVAYMFVILQFVTNSIEQMYYIKKMAQMLELDDRILWDEFSKQQLGKNRRDKFRNSNEVDKKNVHSAVSPKKKATERLLALLVSEHNKEQLLVRSKDDLTKYIDDEYKKLYKMLDISYNKADDSLILDEIDDDVLRHQVNVLSILYDDQYVCLDSAQRQAEYNLYVRRLIQMYYKERLFYIQRELKIAESDKDEKTIKKLLNEFRQVTNILNNTSQ